MLLPCLELIIVAHQLLAKPYSKVVTVAFKGRGAILNLLLLLDGGAQLYYNHVFRELLDNRTGVFESIQCGEKRARPLVAGAGTH